MVGGGCPPPVSPQCRGRAGAQIAPASPLVLPTPPGISPLGIVSCRLWLGNAFYTSWAPHSSGGPRGASVLRPSHVESSNDSTWTQPRLPPHTPRTPLSLFVSLHKVYVDVCLFWECSQYEIANLMKSFKEDGPSYNWENSRG